MAVTIFSDGSSRGNPGPGGWGLIIIREESVEEIGGREDLTTNNRMELTAVIEGLSNSTPESNIEIFTDSAYVLNGATRWIKGWKKNGWLTSKKDEVINKDLWERLDQLSLHKNIEWHLLSGHTGNAGNERCDVIATSFADNKPSVLYKGSRERYGVDLSVLSEERKQKQKNKSRSSAYSYVSMIDGEVMVFKSWEECKKRVSGISGAKFKKSTSPQNEEEIIKEFLN